MAYTVMEYEEREKLDMGLGIDSQSQQRFSKYSDFF